MTDLLDKLEREKQTEDKKLNVDDGINKTLDKMVEIFEYGSKNYRHLFHYGQYESFCKKIFSELYDSPDFNNETISFLPFKLIEYQQDIEFRILIGLYLSALINICEEKDFAITTRCFETSIGYLGYRNCKDLTIDGNVGLCLGVYAVKNNIIVNGDVLNAIGRRSEECVKIYVNGNFSGINRYTDAEIYHNGKLIFKKRQPIHFEDFKYNRKNRTYFPLNKE